jgi:protein NUD1
MASTSRAVIEPLQTLSPRRPQSGPASIGANGANHSPARSRTFSRTHGTVTPARTSGQGNATFLTEASFGVAHDKLVQVITDVQPFEPYWETLVSIDLSNKKVESVTRLKEFLPQLRHLTMYVLYTLLIMMRANFMFSFVAI